MKLAAFQKDPLDHLVRLAFKIIAHPQRDSQPGRECFQNLRSTAAFAGCVITISERPFALEAHYSEQLARHHRIAPGAYLLR